MVSFGIIVIAIHIMQAIWFCIAFKKRLDLENLDKKAAISYLKTRMVMNAMNNNNTSTTTQREGSASVEHQQSIKQASTTTMTTTLNQSAATMESSNTKKAFQITPQTTLNSVTKPEQTSRKSIIMNMPSGEDADKKKQLVIIKKASIPALNKISNHNNTTTTLQINKSMSGNRNFSSSSSSHLKPGHLERSRNLESSDLEDSLSKLSPHNSDTSLNSLNGHTPPPQTMTTKTSNYLSGNNRYKYMGESGGNGTTGSNGRGGGGGGGGLMVVNNNSNNGQENGDAGTTATGARKSSESYYAIGAGVTSDINHNSLSYQYIPLIHQSSRDS